MTSNRWLLPIYGRGGLRGADWAEARVHNVYAPPPNLLTEKPFVFKIISNADKPGEDRVLTARTLDSPLTLWNITVTDGHCAGEDRVLTARISI